MCTSERALFSPASEIISDVIKLSHQDLLGLTRLQKVSMREQSKSVSAELLIHQRLGPACHHALDSSSHLQSSIRSALKNLEHSPVLEEADEGGHSSARPHHHEGHRHVGRGSEGAGRSQAHVDLGEKAISNQTCSKNNESQCGLQICSLIYSLKLKSDNRNPV